MATTTATITLSSGDLTGDALSLSSTSTLTKGGSVTGLDQTYGINRKIYTATAEVVLFDEADFGSASDPAHKVYLRNPSTVATEYFTIKLGNGTGDAGALEIGRLYAGDWMFIPYSAAANTDITITPSVATSMTLESMAIYHS
jgi:hypothetical protein